MAIPNLVNNAGPAEILSAASRLKSKKDKVEFLSRYKNRKDFEEYEPFIWDKGLEFNYRNHKIRVPPFASAGITTLMTLKIIRHLLKETVLLHVCI